ncbi:MAG TPA: lamin tail domain-containing protein, partial [Bacteroidales bacterium]|nr:lamin tail domain-containing protein [Bacteroidales bacterium]
MNKVISQYVFLTATCVFLTLFGLSLKGQLLEDFSDDNFSDNPEWTGDIELFRIDNYQLRLNSASGFDSSFLVTPNHSAQLTEWRFWVRLSFTPSDNNHPRIYLISNTSNLRGPVNGYFIQIGKSGTANKRIFFFRQNGTQTTELLAGTDNLATTSNNQIRIRVVRDNAGTWQIFADGNGGNLFKHQGEITDATFTTTQYFGIFCKYTSSNATRFYFDDFYIGPIVIDTIPPSIVNVRAVSSSDVEVLFSEAVEPVSASNINNYSVGGGIGNPGNVTHSTDNPAIVVLHIDENLQNGSTYQLNVDGVKDFAGNALISQQYSFSYYIPIAYDVVINEIMADPTPEVGLPGVEYIELFNRTEFPINVGGWIFQYGASQRYFSNATILPGSYIIAGNAAAIAELQSFGNTVSIEGLPATALSNSGTTIAILDASGKVIHVVRYTDQWYQSGHKIEGGWSLEQIDPENPCGEANNWTASVDLSGGTLGRTNSVKATNPDLTS